MASPTNPAGKSPVRDLPPLHNLAGRAVLLNELGLILPANDIVSIGFRFTSFKSEVLVREFNQSGIFYDTKENIVTSIRVYLEGNSPIIAASMGLEVKSAVVNLNSTSPAPESVDEEGNEDEDSDNEAEAEEVEVDDLKSEFDTGYTVYYIEYPLVTTSMGDPSRRPIQSHPRFTELFNRSEKNARVLTTKLSRFAENVSRYGGPSIIEPEDEELEDGDDGMTAPRITEDVMHAQHAAHRHLQTELRSKLDSTLDYFAEKVLHADGYGEEIPLSQIKKLFGETETEGAKTGSPENLLADLAKEITYL